MKKEISAGGVIVQKNKGAWEVLLLQDMNGNWTFPKGLVEKNEDPIAAAKREITEEVGLVNITLVKELKQIHYMYTRDGLISKTVQYFLFMFEGNEVPKGQIEEGISDVRWFPIDEAMKTIGYPKTNKKLLEEAEIILKK